MASTDPPTPGWRPALVLFDCDGVLVDTETISHQVLVDVLARHGIALSFDEAIDRFLGTSPQAFEERLRAFDPRAAAPEVLATFRAERQAAFDRELSAVQGIEDLLDGLRIPYCVASNGRHDKMRQTLGLTGLLGRFDGRIFSAEDVERGKPAHDLFLHAARAMGADPVDCLVLDDTPTGIHAAVAARMRSIGFAGLASEGPLRAAGATAVIRHLDEFLPALEALGASGALPALTALDGEGARAAAPRPSGQGGRTSP